VNHAIFVGDHQQIPPRVQVEVLKTKGLGMSTMGRLVTQAAPASKLRVQNRMIPILSMMLRDIYPDYIDGPIASALTPPDMFPDGLLWWNHGEHENSPPMTFNLGEVRRVMCLLAFIIRWGYPASSVVVLTYYTAQVTALEKARVEMDPDDTYFGDLMISTIDSFQGEERDIVILSTVRGNEKGAVGFLRDEGRRCVAISRARRALIIVGNAETVQNAAGWGTYLHRMREMNLVWDMFPFRCEVHQDLECGVRGGPDLGMFAETLLKGMRCVCAI
jgi:hypothetical protein